MRMRAQQMPEPGQRIRTVVVTMATVVTVLTVVTMATVRTVLTVVTVLVLTVMAVAVLAHIRVLMTHGIQAGRNVALPHLDMP